MEQERIEKLYKDKVQRIDKYFNDKQDSIARSVAVNNSTQIICSMIEKGLVSDREELKNILSDLSQFIYNELTQ